MIALGSRGFILAELGLCSAPPLAALESNLTDTMLDVALAAIARHVVPGGTLVRYWPLKGGVSATVYALEIASEAGLERVVLRRHGAATWKQLGPDVTQHEFELLVALSGAGLSVPKPRLLDTSSVVLPSPFFVMNLVDGTTDIARVSLESVLRQMAGFLAGLHALDASTLRLPALPLREDPVQGALEYVPSSAEFAGLRDAVASYQVNPKRPSLLHGDFWPGNILWANAQLVAVIDWEDAAFGPAASDVACCRAELNAMFDEMAARRFTDYYLAVSADGLADLPLWDIYVGSAALATLHHWGLPSEVEALRRQRTSTFVARAAEALVRGS